MNFKSKLKDYLQFTKFRLTFSVVISSLAGFLFAGGGTGLEAFYLLLGGFFVTNASIGTNQILERKLDAQMPRTSKRPLPDNRIKLTEAIIAVIIFLAIGSWSLYQLNLNSVILGLVAYTSYSFIYTPSKRVTPWAVIIGAFPGSIPPMLGAIAVIDAYTALPGALFFIQFIWQLPHFWAIAWVSHEDYKKAGFHLLPSKSGKSKKSAFIIAVSAFVLIPFSLVPWWPLEIVGIFSVMSASILGLLFFLSAYKLFLTLEDKDAKTLMFASFLYLPLILFSYVIDKYYFF